MHLDGFTFYLRQIRSLQVKVWGNSYSCCDRSIDMSFCLTGQWFEVTPHEAGFVELDVFVQTSLLGSKFKNGKLLEEQPEMDMVKLQGGC